MPRGTLALIALILAGAVTITACGGNPSQTAKPVAGVHLGGSAPGSLLSAVTMPKIEDRVRQAGIVAARITYRSTDGSTGRPTVVSGSVFVPDRAAPPGGWRVVALGHGSTGVLNDCAPSSSSDLAEQLGLVIKLVSLGVVVTMTDYQGLGTPGVHPYLDARTAGFNVIDSVRAVRKTFTGVSQRWAAFGGSQGGGAVWAADEQASTYAPELDLVGAVALSPAADLTGLADRAAAGTMTVDDLPAMQWLLTSLGRLHPGLDLDHYRRGTAATNWAELSTCDGPADHGGVRERDERSLSAAELAPDSPHAAAVLRGYLAAWALPQRRLSAPMLVEYGGKDTIIDPAWTTRALARACRLGGVIEIHLDPEGTHAAPSRTGDPLRWIAERFADQPARNDCRPL